MRNAFMSIFWCGAVLLPAGCAVGPGTPLVEAMGAASHPAPTVVAQPGPEAPVEQPHGLIDEAEREQTIEYLKGLSESRQRR